MKKRGDGANGIGPPAEAKHKEGVVRLELLHEKPRAAATSGPSVSTSRSPISSTCRTRLSRDWRTRSKPKSPRPKRAVREGVQNPDAMDLYFQGLAWMNKGVTPDNFSRARGLFARALGIDPVNVEALVGRGVVDAMSGGVF